MSIRANCLTYYLCEFIAFLTYYLCEYDVLFVRIAYFFFSDCKGFLPPKKKKEL